MTKIECIDLRSQASLDVVKYDDGTCGFGIIGGNGVGWAIQVDYDKVLDALGAVSAADLSRAESQRTASNQALAAVTAERDELKVSDPVASLYRATQERNAAMVALSEAQAERDAHAATVERVREVLGWLEDQSDGTHGITYAQQVAWESVFQRLSEALRPKPTFILPTEAGVRFEAQGNLDRPGDMTPFVTLAGAGRPLYMAVDDVDCVYEAGSVMAHYTGHRTIGGDCD